jgi:hypothetical protein
MSVRDFDHFDDEIARRIGVLGGMGYDEFQRVDAEPRDGGIVFQFQCQGCGISKNFTVEWGELIALQNNVDPMHLKRAFPNAIQSPDSWVWRDVDRAWGPRAYCPDCTQRHKRFISIRITEQELANHIRAGLNQGKLPFDYYTQVDAMCKKLYQGGLRAR